MSLKGNQFPSNNPGFRIFFFWKCLPEGCAVKDGIKHVTKLFLNHYGKNTSVRISDFRWETTQLVPVFLTIHWRECCLFRLGDSWVMSSTLYSPPSHGRKWFLCLSKHVPDIPCGVSSVPAPLLALCPSHFWYMNMDNSTGNVRSFCNIHKGN